MASSPGRNIDLSRLIGTLYSAMTRPTMRENSGGYPEDIFLNLNEEERQKYECAICFLVARNCRTCQNGHLFCATCIFTWSMTRGAASNKCPVCRNPGRYSPSFGVDAVLNEKMVKCSFKDCDWAGKLIDFKKHRHANTNTEPKVEERRALPKVETPRIGNQSVHMEQSHGYQTDSHGTRPAISPAVLLNRRVGRPRLLAPPRAREPQRSSWEQGQRPDPPTGRNQQHEIRRFEDILNTNLQNIQRFEEERQQRRRENLMEFEELERRLNELSTEVTRLTVTDDTSHISNPDQGYYNTNTNNTMQGSTLPRQLVSNIGATLMTLDPVNQFENTELPELVQANNTPRLQRISRTAHRHGNPQQDSSNI